MDISIMSTLNFPSPFNPNYRYVTGSDFIPTDIKPTNTTNMYAYASNPVIDVSVDTSNVTNMSKMFNGASNLITVTLFDTSNVTNMRYMFQSCSNLVKVPLFDTSKVTDMRYMFSYCSLLVEVPLFDTSKVTDFSYMFENCPKLTTIPEFDFSSATGSKLNGFLSSCTALREIPNINCKKVTSLDGWTSSCNEIIKVGVIDCDSITNASGLISSSNPYNSVADIGGFRNLGMTSNVSNTNANYFLYNLTNLTRESLLNVFNLLYDRASAGYSILTIKLHANHHAKLTDEDRAIATNKGWALS